MNISISETKLDCGQFAALAGASKIRQAIARRGTASIILATGLSQIEMLAALVKADIDWSVVEVFHLDEYAGIPETHSASFRKYLKDNFVSKVPRLKAFHAIAGDASDLSVEVKRLGDVISKATIDVAFVGIGENGHLAFNDPPADFENEQPYLIVKLDQACRQQQVNEGWFPSVEATPDRAISMSVRQILKSRCIINTVPDERKAKAVAACLGGEVSPLHPASILQLHPECYTFLDTASASLLFGRTSRGGGQ
ncbi:MAG: glucosamine-6-phosphate deaminase [Spirochaetia bacterium]|nr:glucosamine-6-phosphate deaminase [Spirochaetia bacterium]